MEASFDSNFEIHCIGRSKVTLVFDIQAALGRRRTTRYVFKNAEDPCNIFETVCQSQLGLGTAEDCARKGPKTVLGKAVYSIRFSCDS